VWIYLFSNALDENIISATRAIFLKHDSKTIHVFFSELTSHSPGEALVIARFHVLYLPSDSNPLNRSSAEQQQNVPRPWAITHSSMTSLSQSALISSPLP